MRADVNIEQNADMATAAEEATDAYLMDMAAKGFERSQDIVAEEAMDTGNLLRSGIPPEKRPDGSIIWGYQAPYAEDVDQGQPPQHVDLEPLLGWAKRTFGISTESHLYVTARGVQDKIAEEGTEPVRYIARSVETMRGWASSRDAGEYVVDRL